VPAGRIWSVVGARLCEPLQRSKPAVTGDFEDEDENEDENDNDDECFTTGLNRTAADSRACLFSVPLLGWCA
jgi:hypothetical protein